MSKEEIKYIVDNVPSKESLDDINKLLNESELDLVKIKELREAAVRYAKRAVIEYKAGIVEKNKRDAEIEDARTRNIVRTGALIVFGSLIGSILIGMLFRGTNSGGNTGNNLDISDASIAVAGTAATEVISEERNLTITDDDIDKLEVMADTYGHDYKWLEPLDSVPQKYIDAGYTYSNYMEHVMNLQSCGNGVRASFANDLFVAGFPNLDSDDAKKENKKQKDEDDE